MSGAVLPFRPRPSEEDVVGTCDWGDCDRDTAALRWAPNLRRWLSVCTRHTAPPWAPLPDLS